MASDLSKLPADMRAALEAAAEESSQAFENETFDLHEAQTDPLARLAAIRWRRAQMEDEMDRASMAAVQEARAHGASWRRIGESLGVSQQAAMKRFRDKVA